MFKYRLRFELSPEDRLNSDEERVTFDVGAPAGVIELIGKSDSRRISDATELIVRSISDFHTQSDANTAGTVVERALLFAAAQEGLGIDFGKGAPRGALTAHGKRWLAEKAGFEGQIVDDHPGLSVYDAASETRFVKFGPMRGIVGRPLERFLSRVRVAVQASESISAKNMLALEIYNAAQFEHSPRARFLALVTAIEVLSDRLRRSDAALVHISRFIEMVKSGTVESSERDQLLSGLNDLQKESIGAACRRIVNQCCGPESATSFRTWYKARSDLLHSGQTELDVREVLGQLDQIVAQAVTGELIPPTEDPAT